MATPFYITTPIYYVNARPHLGHAYTTIVADVATRFHDMTGVDTFFLTGTDEHGDKIVQAAKDANTSPRDYVDQISALFRDLWPRMDIGFSRFIRTTDAEHIAVVEHVLQNIYDAGDIYFSEYEGMYCFGCERFYTERELVDGKCPDHEKPPEIIREANYFFKMSKYQQWLIDHINENPEFIRPKRYRNEVLAFLREPLEDLCISRPKSRLKWGITLPFDNEYVTYVWFDALLNYVSALGYPDGEVYRRFWPHAQHIVAKDILKPHGIYWPIMLKAAGIPPYQHLNVHGYWNVDQSKMSKSLGNVVDPLELKNVYGLDAFRFFLMREMAFGLDSSFSEEALVQRINSDLANDLGNLLSRVTAMTHKYFDGVVPSPDPAVAAELGLGLPNDTAQAVDEYQRAMADFAFHRGLQAVWDLINQINKYIDVMAPWVLAKKKSTRKELEVVIYAYLEGLRVISGLIYPVMPQSAKTMQKYLGRDPDARFFDLALLKKWNVLPPGTVLPKSQPLFPRVDIKTDGKMDGKQSASSQAMTFEPEITFDKLGEIDLRIGTVTAAEPIPKAKKLLKLQVDIGEPRTIVAGISEHYDPSDLIGKQVVVVANLKPAKLMGVKSNGMLLAAVNDERLALVGPDRESVPGTRLR